MEPFPRWVLVVDDDAATRKVLARELQPIFRVVQADDFESAIRVVDQTRSLVAVVSGHQIGKGPSGAQLHAEVRRRLPSAARVLLSGSISDAQAARLLSDGVIHEYLEKPWGMGEVLEAVSDRLGLLALA
jgi:ActR/RegA family two-component response regulator